MDRSALVRRAFHLSSPAWLVWYWLPPDAGLGVPKAVFVVVFLSAALLIEAVRLVTGRRILGFRDYETDRMSAYAWGSLGLAFGLLFFPGELVIPAFWGMAWIDPLCATAKKRGWYPWAPLLAYGALFVVLEAVLVPLAPYQTTPIAGLRIALYAGVAAPLAILAEYPNWRWVDDDFLMHVVPLLALAALSKLV